MARLQDYFYRTNAPSPRYRAILPMLALQLLLSFGVAGICTLKTGVTPAALTVLLLSLQLSAPASALFTYAYALLTACRRLYSKNATIVGQYTVDEMAARKQLVFAESEMLQAKSSTEIYVKGIGDPKRYVRYARRLFNTLGGTLAKINTSDLSEKGMDGLVADCSHLISLHQRKRNKAPTHTAMELVISLLCPAKAILHPALHVFC